MYNVAHYLEKCVSHIQLDIEDYEILMINDGSPDNSLLTANTIAENNPNCSVLSQDNKGLGGARNLGITNAKGKFILFLDADDILTKQDFSFLRNENADIIEFSAERVTDKGEKVGSVLMNELEVKTDGMTYFLNNNSINSACNKIYASAFLKTNNFLFLEHIYSEDFEFNTRLFSLAKLVYSKSEALQYFVNSENSITRNNDKAQKDKLLKDYLIIGDSIRRFQISNELESNISFQYFQKKYTILTVDLIYHSIKNGFGLQYLVNKVKQLKSLGAFSLKGKISNPAKNLFKYFCRILF